MQSFLRKIVTPRPSLTFCHNSRSLVFARANINNAVSPLPKPSQSEFGHPTFGSFLGHPLVRFHSCRSHHTHTLSRKNRGLLSHPLRVRHFGGLLDCRSKLLRAYFHRQSFHFRPSSDFSRQSWRSWFNRLTPTDMVLGLIIANVAVFMSWRIVDQKFMINNFTISLDNFKSGRLHTLITNAFSHIDTGHIISNMIGLYFFGMNIGRTFGTEFLLKLYLVGAVGGSVFYLMHQAYKAQTSSKDWRGSRELALGASGAVNAIMLLYIFLFPKATLYFDFFIPVPAILLGIFLIGKDMLRIIEGDSQISGSAHLGGAAVAAIAWARVRRGRF